MTDIAEWLRNLAKTRKRAFGEEGLRDCRYEEAAAEIERLRALIAAGPPRDIRVVADAIIRDLNAEIERLRGDEELKAEIERLREIYFNRVKEQGDEIERLREQCRDLAQSAINNGQDLLLKEAKIERLREQLSIAAPFGRVTFTGG